MEFARFPSETVVSGQCKPEAGRRSAARAVEIFYEDLGDPADPPVLLIMGVGAQLPMWPDGFCAQLVEPATG